MKSKQNICFVSTKISPLPYKPILLLFLSRLLPKEAQRACEESSIKGPLRRERTEGNKEADPPPREPLRTLPRDYAKAREGSKKEPSSFAALARKLFSHAASFALTASDACPLA